MMQTHQRSNGMDMRVYAPAVWNPMPNYHNDPPLSVLEQQQQQPWRAAAAFYHQHQQQQQHQLQQQQQQLHLLQQQQQQNHTINLSLMTSSTSEETITSTPPAPRNSSSSSSNKEWLFQQQHRNPEEWEPLSLKPPNSYSTTSSGITSSSSPNASSMPSAAAAAAPAGLDLLNLLLKCAEAIDGGDMATTMALLSTLKCGACAHGDSMQRLAAHYSHALAARAAAIHGNALPKSPNFFGDGDGESLSAFTALYKVSPFFQIAYFTANQAILEATQSHEWVHVIDLDIMAGFQWPSLIQSMVSRPGGPPAGLRITGIGSDEKLLRETGMRLQNFAAACGLAFEFTALPHQDRIDRIKVRPREATAVNAAFRLHRMHGGIDHFLAAVASRIKPVVVTLAEQEASHNSPSFVSRFMQSLQYYAAVFDSLDESLPRRNEERAAIEQFIFARQIANIVACEGDERYERHEGMDFWAAKMSDAGFHQLPLSSHAVSQARLLLQMCPCDGYRLVESPLLDDDPSVGSISLGWHEDRLLLTASAWSLESSRPSSPVSY